MTTILMGNLDNDYLKKYHLTIKEAVLLNKVFIFTYIGDEEYRCIGKVTASLQNGDCTTLSVTYEQETEVELTDALKVFLIQNNKDSAKIHVRIGEHEIVTAFYISKMN